MMLSIVHKCGVGLLRTIATRRKTQDNYEGGAKPHIPSPMDSMLPQDVVGLDRDAPRYMEAHRVDFP